MNKVEISKEAKRHLQVLLDQRITSIDAPDGEARSSNFSLYNLSAIRLVLEDGSTIFFSAISVTLAEGLEVFVVHVSHSLELHSYPGGLLTAWKPIGQFTNKFSGSMTEDIRFLSADWRVVSGSSVQSLYGSNPQFLDNDLSGEADSYNVEDGLILFSSDNDALVISTLDTLAETLSLRYIGS